MITHSGLGKQPVGDEQMPLKDRACRIGEGRTGNRDWRIKSIKQGIGHRADVPLVRGIESRAIFEKDLFNAAIPQRGEGLQRHGNCFVRWIGARFHRDHHSLRLRRHG